MSELTDIKGIGDSKAKELNELGVNTVAELATYEGDDITAELVEKAKGLVAEQEKEAAKSAEPETFEFVFLNGQHGGRKFVWKSKDPLYLLGDGTMPAIDGVTLKEVEDPATTGQKFLFVRNNGKSSAVLPEDVYKRFKIAVAKKKASSPVAARTSGGQITQTVPQTFRQRVVNKLGCRTGRCR